MKKKLSMDTDFIYNYGSVLNERAAAATIIDSYSCIKCLPDKSSIFSADLQALYLALDRVEISDDDEKKFINILSL